MPYLQYWNMNNLCGWTMSQKLPVNNYKYVEDTSRLNEERDKGYFLEVYWYEHRFKKKSKTWL